MKVKSLKKLQTLKVDIPSVYGGWDGIHATPAGTVSGFDYESDIFIDSNGDGQWSSGESIHFYHTKPTVNRI